MTVKEVGRPRDVDAALRAAILHLVPSDGWMSQGEIARRLPDGLLPRTSTGRQRLRTTLLRMRDEDHDLLRQETIPGRGRGPFWRRAVGPLKSEAVHHALYQTIREEVYRGETPDITVGSYGELYVYGAVDVTGFEDTITETLDLLRSAGGRVAEAQQKVRGALGLLREANRGEAKVRRILENLVEPLPPLRFAILIVPFIGKAGRGETFWIPHTKVRTEDGQIVRRVRRIHRPGRKRR